MRSLSEIETASKRASQEQLVFHGAYAEEVGKSVRFLELFGFPGIKNVNQYFIDKKVKKFENLNLIIEKNLTDQNPFCPIILGVSFLDQIRTMESLKKLNLQYCVPNSFLPFLSRASEIIGKKIILNLIKMKFY